ncbi:MAG: hypothetical protein RTU30_05360 [Candidatus Thorarchaeota archaeon]
MNTTNEIKAFRKALENLDDDDRELISKEVDRLSNDIRGFGELSAIELLGKLSVFLYVNDTLDQPQINSYRSAINWAKKKGVVKRVQNDT